MLAVCAETPDACRAVNQSADCELRWVSNCRSGLLTMAVPNSVTSIGFEAFIDATNLTQITLPDSLQLLGSAAFQRTGLLTLQIPARIQRIESSLVASVTALSSVQLPDSATRINDNAFAYVRFAASPSGFISSAASLIFISIFL